MKFSTALASVLAVGASATSPAAGEEDCGKVGSPCFKVQQAIDKFAEAVKSDDMAQASPADKDALAQLGHIVGLSTEDPVDFLNQLGFENDGEKAVEKRSPWCFRKGSFCIKARAVDDAAVDDDDAAVEKRAPWCRKGAFCAISRRSVPVEEEVEKRSPEPWCTHPGRFCVGRRSLQEETGSPVLEARWCQRQGGCDKAKRTAADVLEALGSDEEELSKRSPFCGRPGSICVKARRDVEAIRNAASAIVAQE